MSVISGVVSEEKDLHNAVRKLLFSHSLSLCRFYRLIFFWDSLEITPIQAVYRRCWLAGNFREEQISEKTRRNGIRCKRKRGHIRMTGPTYSFDGGRKRRRIPTTVGSKTKSTSTFKHIHCPVPARTPTRTKPTRCKTANDTVYTAFARCNTHCWPCTLCVLVCEDYDGFRGRGGAGGGMVESVD